MRRISSAALGGALLLGLAGFGAAGCTTIAEPAPYADVVSVAPPGYAAAATAPAYGAYHMPDYVAAARAGDTYCQEATAAVRESAYEAAVTGSPEAFARAERTRGFAHRDC